MRKILLLPLLILLLGSCNKEDPTVESGMISKMSFYSESGDFEAEYNYHYNSDGRLINKSNPLVTENLQWVSGNIDEWNYVYDFGVKNETYYYQGNLDSIRINHEYPLSGLDLMIFYYDQGKCIRKDEIRNDELINEYNFVYENGNITNIILEQKEQNDTLNYVYEYDQSGNVIRIFLNSVIISTFEYLRTTNPLYFVSKPYLTHTPVHPNQGELESITSINLISKANYYGFDGSLTKEITNEYSLNERGQPISALKTTNGLTKQVFYEYQ